MNWEIKRHKNKKSPFSLLRPIYGRSSMLILIKVRISPISENSVFLTSTLFLNKKLKMHLDFLKNK
jgi:hypothetical protein